LIAVSLDAMTDAPMLAVVRNYSDLHRALRARVEQLNISRETIDEIAGFQPFYAAKLLAPKPHRKLGHMSFDAMLGALGCRLLLVEEDAATLARLRPRWVQRNVSQVRSASTTASIEAEPGVKALFMRTIATLGGKARAQQLSDKRRAAIARRAARARWSKVGEEAEA
jgi:hypothetical protein